MVKRLLFKKGLIALFTILLIVSPFTTLHNLAYAQTNDFEWKEKEDGTIEITGYHGTDTAIEIPEKIDGKIISEIGYEAFYNKGLTSVTMPKTIQVIDGRAFMNNKLTSIQLPDSLTLIGNNAFRNNMLENLTIPNQLVTIEYDAFNKNKLTEVDFGKRLKEIHGRAFKNNQLTEITLPNNVEKLGQNAFDSNKLTEVTILRKSLDFSGVIPNGSTDNDPFSNNQEKPEDLTIQGYNHSTSVSFADKMGYSFKSLGDNNDDFVFVENNDGSLTLYGYEW